MASHLRTRGFSLVEVVIAMAVLMLGALGVLSIQAMGTRMNADARVMTKATAIAEDLSNQVRAWYYAPRDPTSDPRLKNTNTSNDAEFADPRQVFERPLAAIPTEAYDLDETAITTGGPSWTGIPSTTVRQYGFRRYVNTAVSRDAAGNEIGLRIAVIVRWERGSGSARRVVLTSFLRDPGVE
jgi:prepilin-type N-terminal cleavage/methylation domain-containing protein